MRRGIAALLVVSLLLPLVSAIDPVRVDVIRSASLETAKTPFLLEHFLDRDDTRSRGVATDNVLRVQWWMHSDQTGSDWPDDDAKSRYEQLDTSGNHTLFNNGEKEDRSHYDSNDQDTFVDLTGQIEIVQIGGSEQWAVVMDLQLTPLANLSDNTVAHLFLLEEDSYDNEGRYAGNLVREYSPQVGFALDEGNSTDLTWRFTQDYLQPAGVDLSQDKGWRLAIAFFGSLEGEEEERLLALYHQPLPEDEDMLDSSDQTLWSLAMLIGVFLVIGIYSQVKRREQGMPVMGVSWSDETSLLLEITASEFELEVLSISASPPYQLKGKVKSRKLNAKQAGQFKLKFSDASNEDLILAISMKVEELGSWTQHLRISAADKSSTD